MTEFLDIDGGRIAYDVTGSGPLVVLSHGIGVRRQDYRFLAPMLAQAGYRVANADLRGHGESSTGWASITRTDVAGDLLALMATWTARRSSSGTPYRAGRPPSPRRSSRNWSAGSSRSTRSPGCRSRTSARCCGSGATAAAFSG